MDWMIANWETIAVVIVSVVSAAAAISAVTPTKTDDKVVNVSLI